MGPVNRTTLALVAVHALTMLFLVLPVVLQARSFTLFLIFLTLESISLLFLSQGDRRRFVLSWEVLLFAVLMYPVLFDFERFFQVRDPYPTAIFSIALFGIVVQIAILLLFVFRERAIRPVLMALASTTSIAVLLIVAFVMKEGAPAFSENNPLEFLTGTEWQPFYDPPITDESQLEVHILEESVSVTFDDDVVYIPPGIPIHLPVHARNRGLQWTNVSVSIESDPGIECTPLSLDLEVPPGAVVARNISVLCQDLGRSSIRMSAMYGDRAGPLVAHVVVICSHHGVDVSPDAYTVTAVGLDSGFARVPFTVTNEGDASDTFILTVEAPSLFHPSVSGEGLAWDYANWSAQLTLLPGETRELDMHPRIVTLIEGRYPLNLTVRSEGDPAVADGLAVTFFFKSEELVLIDDPVREVPANGTVEFWIGINGLSGQKVKLTVDSHEDRWGVELYNGSEPVLHGEGSALFEFTESPQTLVLRVTTDGSGEGATGLIDFKVNYEGTKPVFGIVPFVVGTIVTTAIAILIAAPLGIAVAMFLAEYCPSRPRRVLRSVFELLAGIPSVIYGLWGFLTLGPFLALRVYPWISGSLGGTFGVFEASPNMARSIMTASIVLSIMIVPIIITLSEDALRSVQGELKESSLALGATRWQTLRRVVLRKARSGVVTSVILATGRAIGETMAVMMIMGGVFMMPGSVFDPSATMTSVIASAFGWGFSYPLVRHALFAIGTVLFFMVFALNIIIYRIQRERGARVGIARRLSRLYDLATGGVRRAARALRPSGRRHFGGTVGGRNVPVSTATMSGTYRPSASLMRRERIARLAVTLAALLILAFLVSILGDIFFKGGDSIKLSYLLERERGTGIEGGFANSIIGSLYLVGIAIGLAAPLAIGAAIYLQEYARRENRFSKLVLFTSDTLASTPSIVFGAFGYVFFCAYLGFKVSLLAGGLTLAIMVLPLMLRSSIEAIKAVPHEYREASLALGATKWQTVRNVVIPPALPTVSSGVIISIGRAIGETAAIMWTAGYSASIVSSIMHPSASMSNMIFLYFELSVKEPVLAEKVYSVAMVLVIIVLMLNACAKLLYFRGRRRRNAD